MGVLVLVVGWGGGRGIGRGGGGRVGIVSEVVVDGGW